MSFGADRRTRGKNTYAITSDVWFACENQGKALALLLLLFLL